MSAPVASTSRTTVEELELAETKQQPSGAANQEDDDDDDLVVHEDDHETALLNGNADHQANRPFRPRANTFSRFSFEDFSHGLQHLAIPLTEDARPHVTDDKTLTLWSGVALVVGLQVGSGIFSSPGVIVSDTGSVGASLLVWIGSGVLAWTGASSFAELGAAIPLDGGPQAYLNHSFGPLIAALYSWTTIVATQSSSAAIIATVFGEYTCRVLYHTAFSASSEQSAQAIPQAVIKLVAVLSMLAICAMHAVNPKLFVRAQLVLTSSKILALLAVAIMGIVQAARGLASSSLRTDIFTGSSTSPGAYAIALYSGLWAYSGWDSINYAAGQMRNVTKDLPRVIHISMSVVVFFFLLANLSYFIVLPKTLIAQSNTVALDYGKELFGPVGGIIFAIIVAISCFGALNSQWFTATRLIYVNAHEGLLPSFFGSMSASRTPINAILLQLALATVFVVVGNFRSLVAVSGVCSWVFYAGTVASLLLLRIREPNLPRPYRTWLITPITFTAVSLFLLTMPIFSAPLEALAAFVFIATGLPVYYLSRSNWSFLGVFDRAYTALPSFNPSKSKPARHRRTASQPSSLPRVSEETHVSSMSDDGVEKQ